MVENLADKVIKISNQLVAGSIPLMLGFEMANANSRSLGYFEKTISDSCGVGTYVAVQISSYVLTLSLSGFYSWIGYSGTGKFLEDFFYTKKK